VGERSLMGRHFLFEDCVKENGRTKSFEDIFAKFYRPLDLPEVQGGYSITVEEVQISGGSRAVDPS
jgi:hypothetical protein